MSQSPVVKKLLTVFMAAMAAVVIFSMPPTASANSLMPGGTCQTVQLPVALTAGGPKDQFVHGTLCKPVLSSGVPTVDVLVHGSTYNSQYWDLPVQPPIYSYVQHTLLAGRATFAYDAIGSSMSSRPLSTAVTLDAQAFVLHQVLTWISGMQTNGKPTYAQTDVIGHSLGSIVALDEAANYNDETRLILTGFSHAFSQTGVVAATNALYPAASDPAFAGRSLDPGYMTTRPGTRQALFYGGLFDPAIVAYDESRKDIVSATEIAGTQAVALGPAATSISNRITAPVLEVLGQEDAIFCAAGSPVDCKNPASVQAFDAPYFTHAASLTVRTIPETGHDLTLHPTNPASSAEIDIWIATH